MPPLAKPATPPKPLKPFWATKDGETVRLYHGDVRQALSQLPRNSVQCVVTSPPYWGLREYLSKDHPDKSKEIGSEKLSHCVGSLVGNNCGECYICKMVLIFREVYRVLRKDGILWLNLGDTYGGGNGLASGNLVGIPWRVALALQQDGWILRQDIIWHKKNPMPESVKNRCTKSHEYLFLLTKSTDYFYDAEAIQEQSTCGTYLGILGNKKIDPTGKVAGALLPSVLKRLENGVTKESGNPTGTSNKRSVWSTNTASTLGAHFAVFPTKLVEPCILAGTSEIGACKNCGAPWKRIVKSESIATRTGENVKIGTDEVWGDQKKLRRIRTSETVGWEPGCVCSCNFEEGISVEERVRPCVVLDPFCGTATVSVVSLTLGRNSWGIDLSEEYLSKNAIPRLEGYIKERGEEVESRLLEPRERKRVTLSGTKVLTPSSSSKSTATSPDS